MNWDLLNAIPPDAGCVLEVGGEEGGDLREEYLRRNPDCLYIRVAEASLAALTSAGPEGDAAASGAEGSLLDLTEGCLIDCAVFDRSLRKLRDPRSALDALVRQLAPKAQVVLATEVNADSSAETPTDPASSRAKGQLERSGLPTLLSSVGMTVWRAAYCRERRGRPEQLLVSSIRSGTEVRRTLIQTMLLAPEGCAQVRVHQPNAFLSTIPGVRCITTERMADLSVGLPGEEKVFVWQRPVPDEPFIRSQKALLARGYLTVVEVDDYPGRWTQHEDTQFLAFRGCHAIQTSTPALAEFLRQYNPNVVVFPNQVVRRDERWLSRVPGRVRIFFGALNRKRDWQSIIEGLNRVIARNDVEISVLHDRAFYDALATESKRFRPFSTYDAYMRELSEADIALLPLTDSVFNRMKSDLKFVESAASGTVALAGSTVYPSCVRDGQTGLLYEGSAEFELKLQDLISDDRERERIAHAAFEWAGARLLKASYRRRHTWYAELLGDHDGLSEALQRRAPEFA